MLTLKEVAQLLETSDSFVQVVVANQEDWQQFVIKLDNDVDLLNERIEQLVQQEVVYESRLKESVTRAHLVEIEKNQTIEVKLHIQEELSKTQTLIVVDSHNESKETQSFSTIHKKFVKFNDSEKFTEKNKEKLKAWLIEIHIKMRVNADWFVKSEWFSEDTRQSKMLYVIDRLNDDALSHVKSHIIEQYTIFEFADWQIMINLIKQIYDETNFEETARRKIINCSQDNRDFEDFWSYLHRNAKQVKLSDAQILLYLRNKLNSEIINQLVNILDMSNELHAYVEKIRKLNVRMKEAKKKDARRLYRNSAQNIIIAINNSFRINITARNAASIFKSSNSSVSSSKSAFIRAVTASEFSNFIVVSDTHSSLMNFSSSSKRDSLIQKERKYRRKNNLCNYCEEFDHFVANHQNSATLNAKKRAYNLRLASAQMTSHYIDIIDESATKVSKNESFSS